MQRRFTWLALLSAAIVMTALVGHPLEHVRRCQCVGPTTVASPGCTQSSNRLNPTPIPHVESMSSQSAGPAPALMQPPAQLAKAKPNVMTETMPETTNHAAPINKVVPFRPPCARA